MKDISIHGKGTRIKWKNILKYRKIKFIMLKFSCLHAASIKTTVGNELSLFLTRSTFLSALASVWPERSGATT